MDDYFEKICECDAVCCCCGGPVDIFSSNIGWHRRKTLGRELSNHVKAFIAEHVRSVLHLEVLLLLRQKRENVWIAEAVDRELHLGSMKSAGEVLDDLVAGGLLSLIDGASEDSYRYNPSSDQLDKIVGQLASAYATQRVAVLTLIFANPVDKVRLFTETFRMIRNTDTE